VEEGIQALGGSLEVRLSVEHDRGRLRIELRSHQAAEYEQLLAKLATARARLELIGGTLQTSSNGTGTTGILAEIPLRVARDSPEPAERHGHTRDRQQIEPLVSAVT
jgi:hypothetical protein